MRTPRSIATLVLVVAALVIGSVGVSTAAAPVTKAVVKKISKKVATKVVKQQAPELSVAHADTADTADSATTAADSGTVGGLDAAALQSKVFHHVLDVRPAAATNFYSFPGVPAGTYLVSYTIRTTNSAVGATLTCQVPYLPGTMTTATASATSAGTTTTINATALISVGGPPTISCSVDTGTYTISGAANVVDLIRIDTLVTGSVSD